MRPASTLLPLVACVGSFVPVVSAWPRWLPDVDSLVVRDSVDNAPLLHARQTDAATTNTITKAPKPTNTDSGDDSEASSSRKSRSRGGSLNTAVADDEDEDGDKSETGSKKTTRKSTRTIPPDAPPGGVSMITPTARAGTTELVKIGDYMELEWNYTSILSEPAHVDVILSCSFASETWTLTSNMSFETAASFLWNTNDIENDDGARLLTEMYTLIIKDSDAEISDSPEPGLLGAAPALTFGMYNKVPYTPLSEWECVGCSAAVPGFERGVASLALTMSLITVLSFTWFVTGLGLN